MNISKVNAYGYQPQAYVPRFQGATTEPQNLPQKKGKTKKVLLWSGLGIALAAVAAFLLKGKGIKNLLKKPTSPKVSVEPPKPHVETPKPKVETPNGEAPKTKTPKGEAPKVETTEIPLKDTNPPKVSKLTLQETERNFFKKPTAPEVSVEPPKPHVEAPKPHVETPKPKVETPNGEAPKTKTPKGEAPKVETTEIPLKDTNPLKVRKLTLQETERNIEHANKIIKDAETGLSYYYNADGYVYYVLAPNRKLARLIERNADGSVYRCTILDVNGNTTRIDYNPDGTVM